MLEFSALFVELLALETDVWSILSVRMVIYQPQFFPRLHYFARVLNSDVYGIADNVQFVRKHSYHRDEGSCAGPSYQAHTPIKTAGGVLLVDYATENGFKTIQETRIVFTARNDKFRPLRLIEQHYRKAPQFERVIDALRTFAKKDYATVGEMNIASTVWSLGMLLETPSAGRGEAVLGDVHDALAQTSFRLRRVEALSSSGVSVSDKKSGRDANDWLIDTCRAYGANEYYYGGTGAAGYMDMERFVRSGISPVQQEWKCEPYTQLWGDFIPNLSVIDVLMNVEPAAAREMLHTN